MISIYDAKTEQLRIGPYSWMPFPHVDFWLQQDDKQILEVRIYRLGKSYISGPCFPLCKEKKGFRLATSGFAFGSGTYFQDATGRSCRRGRGTLGGAARSVCVPVNATHASLLLMVWQLTSVSRSWSKKSLTGAAGAQPHQGREQRRLRSCPVSCFSRTFPHHRWPSPPTLWNILDPPWCF